MRIITAAVLAVLSLATVSCTSMNLPSLGQIGAIGSAVASTQVSAQKIVAAANAFDLIKIAATQYLVYCRLHLAQQVCAASNRRAVIRAGRNGTKARNQLEAVIDSGAPAGPVDLFNALVAATAQLQKSPATQFVDPSQATSFPTMPSPSSSSGLLPLLAQ